MRKPPFRYIFSILITFILSLWCSGAYAYKVGITETGAEIKWNTNEVTFYSNTSGGPADSLAAIQAAMQTWTDVSTSTFIFNYGGTTSSTAFDTRDGTNIIGFGTDTIGVLGRNHIWYNGNSGYLYDSGITLNTYYPWVTDGSANGYDVQAVATHELGHSLKLGDLYSSADTEKTMYGYIGYGETKKRTLEQDDIDGITYLYSTIICTYSISPTSQSLGSSGGSGNINVTAGSNCSWIAVSNSSWITITSGSSGTGNGTVYYTVESNTSDSFRTGTISIHGDKEYIFTITQFLPPCTDSYEPNDIFSEAYGPLSSGSSYSGKLCSDTDDDWFKVNITSTGMIALSLTVPSSNNYDLALWDPSDTKVAYSSNGLGVSESIDYSATTTGIYHMLIYEHPGSFNLPNSYTLTYTYTATAISTPTPIPTSTPCTDSYEPNDSLSEAYGPLSSGSSYSGKLCSDTDDDWFKVNITSTGTIALSLTVPSSNDYDLILYDSFYTWVADSGKERGVSESINYSATTTGNYYIRILGYGGSFNTSSSYTLTYTYTATATATPTPTPTATPTPITCTYSISPTSQSLGSSGGSGNINVTASVVSHK